VATLVFSSRTALTARRSRRGLPDPLLDHGLGVVRRLGYLLKLSLVNMMAPTPAAFAASSAASLTSMGWLRIWCPAISPMGTQPASCFFRRIFPGASRQVPIISMGFTA